MKFADNEHRQFFEDMMHKQAPWAIIIAWRCSTCWVCFPIHAGGQNVPYRGALTNDAIIFGGWWWPVQTRCLNYRKGR